MYVCFIIDATVSISVRTNNMLFNNCFYCCDPFLHTYLHYKTYSTNLCCKTPQKKRRDNLNLKLEKCTTPPKSCRRMYICMYYGRQYFDQQNYNLNFTNVTNFLCNFQHYAPFILLVMLSPSSQELFFPT